MRHQRHIAQVNVARARAPIGDPLMAGFVARLEEINALADASPGFVWRLQTDAGDATSLQPYDDERILINLSVWETPEQLKQYVYRSVHAEVMRERKAWFERFGDVYTALWWINPGHIPTVTEATERLQHLRVNGESEFAFSFARVLSASAAGATIAASTTGAAEVSGSRISVREAQEEQR